MKFIIITILFLFITCNTSICQNIPEVLLGSSVLIEGEKGNSGSGYFVSDSTDIYLITAKHVIINLKTQKLISKKIKITISGRNPESSKQHYMHIDLERVNKFDFIGQLPNDDIVVIWVGILGKNIGDNLGIIAYFDYVKKDSGGFVNTIPLQSIKKYEDIVVGSEIFIFGYPQSIGLTRMPQFDYTKPLLRHGIVAGKYDSLKTLVLDCPVYYGNSGGPVVQKITKGFTTEYNLVGTIIEFIPYIEEWISNKSNMRQYDNSNSGYSVAISADRIEKIIGIKNKFPHLYK